MKVAVPLLVGVLAFAPRLGAQPSDLLTDVRALYESAAYEEALTKLADVDPSARTPALEQYRAFCLIALGRLDQATAAIERAVDADPDFTPSPSDASPRIRTMFEDTRRKLLPTIIKKVYGNAKASFSANDYAAANAGFARVLALSTSLGPDAPAELQDLRLVAKEFVDLSTQRLAAAKPASVPAPAPATPASAAASTGESRAAVALSQALPAWTRRAGGIGSEVTLTGEVTLAIDETGAVISAKTTKVSDPAYDALVVETARKWRYSPAMRNGKPLPSEKSITYVLKPR